MKKRCFYSTGKGSSYGSGRKCQRKTGLRDQALMSFLLLMLMAEISRGEYALGK